METLTWLVDLVLHVDQHLAPFIAEYGGWTYALLFAIVFCETGLVVTPILPGDSLLFAAGAFAAADALSLPVLLALLIVAAVLGDSVNYAIGQFFGRRLLSMKWQLIKPSHLEQTHQFFEDYGAKTIVIARFVPIVRTLAPFVAGLGAMSYPKFMTFNVAGGVLWVVVCTVAGYLVGNLPIVRENFSLVILGVVALSLMPPAFEWWRHRRRAASPRRAPPGEAGSQATDREEVLVGTANRSSSRSST
jgi:membrane-associated protein